MRATRYWQLCALLPVVVPLLFGLVISVGAADLDQEANSSLHTLSQILGGSLLIGGIPYIVFTAVALLLLRGRPAVVYQRVSFVIPIVFSALFVGVLQSMELADESEIDWAIWLRASAISFLFVLGVAYPYVLIANLGYWLLSRLGLLAESPGT